MGKNTASEAPTIEVRSIVRQCLIGPLGGILVTTGVATTGLYLGIPLGVTIFTTLCLVLGTILLAMAFSK